jgi:endonuclease/exonuclease/phosphatase family metal-dependent hydrolase
MENQGLSETGFVERSCTPRHAGFLRIVHWNIEKGKRWALLERCLDSEAINSADILCLNEADYGMARSGNRHIAFEIAERLGMSAVFAPAFYEFTKGIGDERQAPGNNTASLQGNALLTRLRVVDHRNVFLPQCHDPATNEERRAGGRAALIARLCTPQDFTFTLAVAHLEVVATRRCRSRQLRAVLDEIGRDSPAIIAGDFNTNTFDRGSVVHTITSLIQLLTTDVKQRVTSAWKSEPLFSELRADGFSWHRFNDEQATNVVDLSTLEDQRHLPRFVVNMALRRGRYVPLRLDWIVCRGFRAVRTGRTITDLPAEPSDHLPITCDLEPA